MRRILLILLLLMAVESTACSFSLEFVIVNESDSPIEVWFEIDSPPNHPNPIIKIGPLSTTKASQLSASDKGWRELPVTEYQFDRETRTVTVRVLAGEALLVKRCHDTGISLPVDRITIAGAGGEISFQGEQAFKAFVKQTDTLFTLTYK